MMYFTVSLCVLYALIATAHGGSCLHCHQMNNETCKEESIDCQEDCKCVVISELQEIHGVIYHSLYKGCARNLPCNAMLHTSSESAYLRVNIKCCSGNDCNTNNYEMPPYRGEPNGKMCPSCFNEGLMECISDKEMMCKGNEDKCVEYIGRVRMIDGVEKEMTIKGCTTSFTCEVGYGVMVGVQEIFNLVSTCK
ncbi:phospholipase A2 inhibitor NAI-like [Ascaphus truei]|uniref:phospholipase A2 inhibitor NAI-like n=1 Tax=Ascaphus truei TaxID=8439 RepID=UPI003F5AB12C